jgi:TolB protein
VVQNDTHYQAIDASNVDVGSFKRLGAEHLVIGKVQPSEKGSYDVVFHLIDTCKSGDGPTFSMRFSGQRPEKFRALAHHISDLIFEKIIGVRGFFSTRIAYITIDRYPNKTVHTLTVADSDGYNDKPVVVSESPLMSPKWSPDGNSIAYVSFEGNRSSLKIVNVYNGSIKKVSNSPGINGAPAWSPDGKSLAMVLSKDGYPKIYVAGLEDKSIKRVTEGSSIDTEPCWDPSGQSIIFTSNRGGNPQVYRVMLNSKEVSRLTFNGDYNATPSITPDGSQLILLHKHDGAFNIAVQSLKTGKVNLLTRANLDESPTIAPNGLMVLYGTKENNGEILGAVSLDGRFKMRLPVKDGNVKEPAWSPYLS